MEASPTEESDGASLSEHATPAQSGGGGGMSGFGYQGPELPSMVASSGNLPAQVSGAEIPNPFGMPAGFFAGPPGSHGAQTPYNDPPAETVRHDPGVPSNAQPQGWPVSVCVGV